MDGAGSGAQGTLLQNAILGHIDLKLMEFLPESVRDPTVGGSLPTPGGGSTLISKGKRTLGRPRTSRPCSAAPGVPTQPPHSSTCRAPQDRLLSPNMRVDCFSGPLLPREAPWSREASARLT